MKMGLNMGGVCKEGEMADVDIMREEEVRIDDKKSDGGSVKDQLEEKEDDVIDGGEEADEESEGIREGKEEESNESSEEMKEKEYKQMVEEGYVQPQVYQPNSVEKPIDEESLNSEKRTKKIQNYNKNRKEKSIDIELGTTTHEDTDCVVFLHSYNRNCLQGLFLKEWILVRKKALCLFDFHSAGRSEGKYSTYGFYETLDLDSVEFI